MCIIAVDNAFGNAVLKLVEPGEVEWDGGSRFDWDKPMSGPVKTHMQRDASV